MWVTKRFNFHHIKPNRIPQNGIWMEKLSMWVTQWPHVMLLIAEALVIEIIATTWIIFWQQRMMEVIIFLCLTRWNWLKSVSHPTAPSYVFRSVTVPNCFVLPSTSVQHESFFCRSYSDWNNPGLEKSNNSVPAGKVQFVKIPVDNVWHSDIIRALLACAGLLLGDSLTRQSAHLPGSQPLPGSNS